MVQGSKHIPAQWNYQTNAFNELMEAEGTKPDGG
jgi:hypothetical protein